jgi:hypothetical protein
VDREAFEAWMASTLPEGADRERRARELTSTMQEEPERKFRRGVYISCWHRFEEEQAAMWRVYAAHHGIAIRTTFDDLTKSIVDDRRVYAGAVRYIDYKNERTEIIQWNAFSPHTCKRRSFQSDNEVRLVISDPALADAEEPPEGIFVRVDLDRLVRDVFVSPEQPKWFADVVIDVVGKYGIPPERVTHSTLYEPI